jgi:hypothetical protein
MSPRSAVSQWSGGDMSAALSAGEQVDLTALEEIVDKGIKTFIEVGRALAEIRDRRLYRDSHSTFEEYCHDRWLLSRTRAYQLIDAAGVVDVMSTMVDTPPASERQARELVPLKDDEQEMVKVWRGLRERHGDRLTARLVKVEVERCLARRPKVSCPGCPRLVLADRIDAPRRRRAGCCPRCGNKFPVENTFSISAEEIDSERKRQLAEKAVERFWKVVMARERTFADEPLHEVIHVERALALLTEEQVADAITRLENGVAETKALLAVLRRHRERNGGSS